MSNGVNLVTVDGVSSTQVMKVPVGPFPDGGAPRVITDEPYDFLYICSGLLAFAFNSDNGEKIGQLTTHGPNERAGVPIFLSDGTTPLSIVSPITHQLMTIRAKAITISLAAIDNDQDDNGIWTVDSADILSPSPNTSEPELEILIRIQGASGIVFRRVSYSAFFQTSPIT
jgi:hypothetical protein